MNLVGHWCEHIAVMMVDLLGFNNDCFFGDIQPCQRDLQAELIGIRQWKVNGVNQTWMLDLYLPNDGFILHYMGSTYVAGRGMGSYRILKQTWGLTGVELRMKGQMSAMVISIYLYKIQNNDHYLFRNKCKIIGNIVLYICLVGRLSF